MKVEEVIRYHRAMAQNVSDATTRSWHRQAAQLLTYLADRRGAHARNVKQGLARAQANGKQIGRKRIPAEVEERARQMLLAGAKVQEVMAETKIGAGTVTRIRKALES
jgi:DNA invertase Pin-like site-specific DNA recombinase